MVLTEKSWLSLFFQLLFNDKQGSICLKINHYRRNFSRALSLVSSSSLRNIKQCVTNDEQVPPTHQSCHEPLNCSECESWCLISHSAEVGAWHARVTFSSARANIKKRNKETGRRQLLFPSVKLSFVFNKSKNITMEAKSLLGGVGSMNSKSNSQFGHLVTSTTLSYFAAIYLSLSRTHAHIYTYRQ